MDLNRVKIQRMLELMDKAYALAYHYETQLLEIMREEQKYKEWESELQGRTVRTALPPSMEEK